MWHLKNKAEKLTDQYVKWRGKSLGEELTERFAKHFTFFFTWLHLDVELLQSHFKHLHLREPSWFPEKVGPHPIKLLELLVLLFWSTFNNQDALMNNIMIFKYLITILQTQWLQGSHACPQHTTVSINNPISDFWVNNWMII